mmetsp:Transcript_27707/g.60353  ORF Transcript_27707/g.60353 Transcript_27707/m.60353 type:complete len:202 (-) Transcript_27707:77-682(-)
MTFVAHLHPGLFYNVEEFLLTHRILLRLRMFLRERKPIEFQKDEANHVFQELDLLVPLDVLLCEKFCDPRGFFFTVASLQHLFFCNLSMHLPQVLPPLFVSSCSLGIGTSFRHPPFHVLSSCRNLHHVRCPRSKELQSPRHALPIQPFFRSCPPADGLRQLLLTSLNLIFPWVIPIDRINGSEYSTKPPLPAEVPSYSKAH